MTALLAYDEACRAVAAALSIDEAKDWRDKADALRVYARQARNRQLEIDASEIRIRAERRVGELLADHRQRGVIRVGTTVRKAASETPGGATDCATNRLTLSDLGINEPLGDRARRYAELPEAEFEARLAKRRDQIAQEARRVGVGLFDKAELVALKAERRAQREVTLGERQTAMPDKRYGIILDDPEWRFEVRSRESGLDRAADNHYPTSDLATILARPVTSLAAPDCAWFRWCTVPFLAAAVDSVRVDGFTYRSSWVWGKDRVGTGYWNRNKHEILLLAVRGDVPCPAPGRQWESLLEAPVAAHSAKPPCFLEMIESYFPTLPKIELNRRGAPRPGWDAWGNEAELTTEAA